MDSAPSAAQPGIVQLDKTGDFQFDRPSAPAATSAEGEADPPLRADSSADASHPEEIDPTAPTEEPPLPPDSEIIASRLEARGARITRDGFQSVINIDLSNTDIIDADLEHLHLFDSLQQLNLSGTRISNAGLDHLTQARELEFLGLTGTQLDDAGVSKIVKLPQLRFLSLAGTDVTDAGLESLSQMRKLEAINLAATLATTDGVAALQSRLPGCRIIFETRSETGQPAIPPGNQRQPATESDLEPSSTEASNAPRRLNAPNQGTTAAGATFGPAAHDQLDLTRLYPTPNRIAAQRQLELVLRKKLSDPEVLHALAAVRAAEGNWREAKTTIRAALEQHPGDPGLQFDFAVTLAQCHELQAAFTEFERAVGRAAAHYNLGVLLTEQGRFAAGRGHFLEAVALDPTLEAARDWLAYTAGDSVHSPRENGGHGLLSDQEFHSLFGSLLDNASSSRDEIVIRPATVARPAVDAPLVQPASLLFSPFSTSLPPIRTNRVQNR